MESYEFLAFLLDGQTNWHQLKWSKSDTPRKINGWKLRMPPLEKENPLNQTINFQVQHVNLRGCTTI